jgi:LysR family transcriptional regulator, regulator for metE and metH
MGTMHASHTRCRLEIRHLRLVQAIATEGTVTHAAGRLHLSQSAVSHQLVDLERDLSTRLFDRIGKRMIPTAAGHKVLALAERLLTELASLERDLADNGRHARIPLRVTTSCYTSYEWLPAALAHFAKAHPRVDIAIVLEATRRGMEALIADEVDLAIVAEPPKDSTWTCVPIVTSQFVAVANPKHVTMTRGALEAGVMKWRDLRNTTVLVHDISDELLTMLENAVRDSWHAKSGERLIHPIELRRIPLTEALIELARSNHGVVIADRFIVEPYLRRSRRNGRERDLACFPFAPAAERSFHVVWRRQNPRALPVADLARIIQDAGRRALGEPAPRSAHGRR